MNTVTVSAGGEGSFCNLFPAVISSPGGLRGKVFFFLSLAPSERTKPWADKDFSLRFESVHAWKQQRWLLFLFPVIPFLNSCLVSSKTVLNTGARAQDDHWEQVCKVACGAANTPCRWIRCLCFVSRVLSWQHPVCDAKVARIELMLRVLYSHARAALLFSNVSWATTRTTTAVKFSSLSAASQLKW